MKYLSTVFIIGIILCFHLDMQAQVKKPVRKKVIGHSNATCTPKSDSLELIKFYKALQGGLWKKPWNLTKPKNTWEGVSFSKSGCVSEIVLSDNNLIGSIPTLNLPALVQLMIDEKKVNGPFLP
jgi:hypothetical protein